ALASEMRTAIAIDASAGRAFVVGSLAHFDGLRWSRAIERLPPVFVRSLFLGTGPHALFERVATKGRPDRVAPLVALLEKFVASFPISNAGNGDKAQCDSLRLETSDTNEGKQ